ncbi:MAG: HD domain-containing protein [Gemmatimonadota bacterium]
MSDADSTEDRLDSLSPVELAAARGELPEWSRVSTKRRAHMGRVAALMEVWAHGLGLPEDEALRWAAAGWLHDALRDEDPERLVHFVSGEERQLPGPVLHGPAAAARLKGTVDPRVVTAIRYHTIGHPRLDRMGRALYLADFLEPGRDFAEERRTGLRARMPAQLDEVLVEVLGSRIKHLIEKRKPIRAETALFWSSVLEGGSA